MNLGPNVLGQKGLSNYRVSANASLMKPRINGINVNWAAVGVYGNEKVTVTITGGPSGGSFTLTYGGQTTAAIAYNATADAAETAIEALSTIGNGNIKVSGASGGPYTLEGINDLANTNLAAFTKTSSLTGGTSPDVTISTVDGAVQLPVGVTVPAGEKVIPAGTIIWKNGSAYEPANDTTTLVRGQCYIADKHFFYSIETNMIGDVFDDGTVYQSRLLVGGTGQPTLANFRTAFPDVTLLTE